MRRPATPSSSVAIQSRRSRGSAAQSRASGSAMTASICAASATLRAIGPTCATVPVGDGGQKGTRPWVGLMPKTPVNALGMRIDPARRTLWVASQAFPSMDGYREDEKKPSAVFEYDADSGRLRRKHVAPSGAAPPAFDDLTVAPDGTVFVNDGESGRIWTISPGGTLQVFLESEAFEGTQGMAVSENGKTLYVSDYQGLFAIDLPSRRVTPLSVPADLSLSGIDGLTRAGSSLVAIQNGVIPHRVIRIDLASDGVTIVSSRILEMNHPDFDEPTLGVVVDGVLYFSADSQGQKFLDAKNPPRQEEMRDAVILRLPLAGERAK